MKLVVRVRVALRSSSSSLFLILIVRPSTAYSQSGMYQRKLYPPLHISACNQRTLNLEEDLNDVSPFFMSVLLPCLVHGDPDELRAFLETKADRETDSAAIDAIWKVRHLKTRGEWVSPSATSGETFVASTIQKGWVNQYVNAIVCHQCGLSLLMLAVTMAPASAVAELLVWGADPNYVCTPRADCSCVHTKNMEADKLSALGVAVKANNMSCVYARNEVRRQPPTPRTSRLPPLSRPSPPPLLRQLLQPCSLPQPPRWSPPQSPIARSQSVIRVLLAAGCKVIPAVWAEFRAPITPDSNFLAVFEILLTGQVASIPIQSVAYAINCGFTGVFSLLNSSGVCVNWSLECLYNDLFQLMTNDERAHVLLKVPARTRQQKLYKTSFCQFSLVKLVRNVLPYLHHQITRRQNRHGEAFFSRLLEEGAKLQGWSRVQTTAIVSIFKRLALESVDRCLGRFAFRYGVRRCRDYLGYWPRRYDFLRFENQMVCDMSQHQCVRDIQHDDKALSCSQNKLSSLQSSCRDVILSSLLDNDDVMDSVGDLPLPETTKDFLLSNH